MNIFISDATRNKIEHKHGLTEEDITEAFANWDGRPQADTREEHKTDPETLWFVAETNRGVNIKVVYVLYPDGRLYIKSAYKPSSSVIDLYNKLK